jgi:hypothetical protein
MNQATAAALAHPWPMGLDQVGPDCIHFWMNDPHTGYMVRRWSPATGPEADLLRKNPSLSQLMCDQIGALLLKS